MPAGVPSFYLEPILMFILLFALFSLTARAEPLEAQVLAALNQLRADPRSFLPDLRRLEKQFRKNRLPLEGNTVVVTREGKGAVVEAIHFLEKAKAAPALALSEALRQAARD